MWSPDALRDILKYTDGVTVDLKAFTDKFYREVSSASLEPVLKTLKMNSRNMGLTSEYYIVNL